MQPSQYGLNFAGPFLGLNTLQAPTMLAPGFATVAENVLISRAGAVRPREPFVSYADEGLLLAGYVVGMVHVDETTLAGYSGNADRAYTVLAKTRTAGDIVGADKLWRLAPTVRDEIDPPGAYSDVTTEKQPTWVFANRWLYIVDGASPLYKYNGQETRTVGIEPPVVNEQDPLSGNIRFIPVPSGSSIAAGTYQYAVTFYDSETGVESNPVYSDEFVLGVSGNTIIVEYLGGGNLLPGRGIDVVRIYRKTVRRTQPDGETYTTSFYRLIRVFYATGSESQQWQDETGLDTDFDPPIEDIDLSDTVSGPFAPSRNGPPPAALIAAYYKSRMWYADPDHGSRLWYSELDEPDHVDAFSSVVIGGDPDDRIAGMVEMAGQLVIVKEGSIWILSGDLVTYTNLNVARGETVFEQAPEIYKTKSKTGGQSVFGGNGVIVCGHPPLLYYTRTDGLYRFDGVDDRPVSDLIGDEWAAMMLEAVRFSHHLPSYSITFANDVVNQVLYVCLSRTSNFEPKRVLCYHWGLNRGDGVGVWTVLYLDDPNSFCGCVATALGKPETGAGAEPFGISVPAPLLIGEQFVDGESLPQSRIRYADSEGSNFPVPAWKYRTGDLPLAGGKKAHGYYLEYRHGRYRGGIGAGPLVKVQYALDADDLTLLGNLAGQETSESFMRRLHLGRTGRSMSLEFSRGDETTWDAWDGITGFAVDLELAEQR